MAARNTTHYVHTFTIDGVEHKLKFKPFAQIPAGILRKNRKNDEEASWQIIEWGLSAEDLEIFDQVPTEQMEAMFKAWEKSAEITAGESGSSST